MRPDEKSERDATESEKEFEEFLRKITPFMPKILDEWFKIPRETRLEILVHGEAGIAVLSLVTTKAISDSVKSMAKWSADISYFTKWLVGLRLY